MFKEGPFPSKILFTRNANDSVQYHVPNIYVTDRESLHTLTIPRHKNAKLTTLSLNRTFVTRVLTRSVGVYSLARAINFPKRSL
jgi:hypothetical protein